MDLVNAEPGSIEKMGKFHIKVQARPTTRLRKEQAMAEQIVTSKVRCLFAWLSMACATALGACTSPMASVYPYKAGWRHVEFVGRVSDGIPNLPISIDCREEINSSRDPGKTFVLVRHSYRQSRWFVQVRYWIVTADDRLLLNTRDILYANSMDCLATVVPSNVE